MKIAYIVPKLANKAPIMIVQELVKQMTKHNHHCTVYYFDEGGTLEFPCETIHIPSFYAKIQFKQYDVVHTHGFRPDLYIYYHKPPKDNTLYISTIHSYILPDLSSQYNKFIAHTVGRIWLHCLKRQDKIVTLSKNATHYYQKWFSPKKLYWVYNTREITDLSPLPDTKIKNLSDFKKDSLLIGVNAMLSPIKGIDQLIKCLPYIPDYKLYIIGDGNIKSQLIQLSHDLGVADRCYFAGYQENAYKYLPYYDIYAMPSRNEGFSLAVLEAAIFKKNIICSDIPIFRELYSEKEVSFFEVDNLESLIKSIKEISASNNKGVQVYQKYISSYSPEHFYTNYLKIYQNL